jgi:spore coat protein U-like protein
MELRQVIRQQAGAPWLLAALAPAAAANGNCLFRVNGSLSLAFGALDPSVASNVVQSVTVGSVNSDQVGNCRTGSMTVTVGNGANFASGTRRLRNGTNYIPYTLSSPPTAPWTGSTTGPWSRARPGNGTYVAMPTISGTILGTDYVNAAAGAYSDTVVITLSP